MSDSKLSQSGLTMHSDSELYSESPEADYEASSSSPSPPLVVYKPPSMWLMVRGLAINLLLPFVNGMMLGFGELFAHEAAFRLGWGGTKVFPITRRRAQPLDFNSSSKRKSYYPLD